MLRQLVLEEHLHPGRLFPPWFFAVLAGWLLLHHLFIAAMIDYRNAEWAFVAPTKTTWMLGSLAVVGIVWSLLVQLRRVHPGDGTGLLLSGFGLWVVQWVDTMAMLLVELPPHYLSRAQFGETQAALCIGAGYVAYAVGLGLVVGGVITGWRRGDRGFGLRAGA